MVETGLGPQEPRAIRKTAACCLSVARRGPRRRIDWIRHSGTSAWPPWRECLSSTAASS